ncbi:MAG: hypothetical protein WA947_04720 [Phormidesmis sp.]
MQPSWLPVSGSNRYYAVLIIFINVSIVAISTLLIVGLVDGWDYSWVSALFFGLIICITDFSKGETGIITPVEILTFSQKIKMKESEGKAVLQSVFQSSGSGAKFGLIFGCTMAMASFVATAVAADTTVKTLISIAIVWPSLGFFSGLALGAILSMFDGLVGRVIDELKVDFTIREIPNQGILASAKNCLTVSCLSYPFCFLISYFLLGSELLESLLLAAFFSIYFGYYKSGGLPVIQHVVLRSLLYQYKCIPLNYAKFLKYTTERRLTQQIGGSFRFIHRELLDHFAAMELDSSEAP